MAATNLWADKLLVVEPSLAFNNGSGMDPPEREVPKQSADHGGLAPPVRKVQRRRAREEKKSC